MSKIQIVLICVVFVTLAEVGVASGRRFNQCPITACTEQYEPVCGSDGETYSNPCYLAAARCSNRSLRKVRDGECNAGGQNCPPVFCTADYTPVCGSDGKTYSNECGLNGAKCENPGLRKVHDGEC